MNFIDYRRELGIGIDNIELQRIFFNRIFDYLADMNIMKNVFSEQEYISFCFLTGQRQRRDLAEDGYWDAIQIVLDNNSQSIEEFFSYYMSMIKCLNNDEMGSSTKILLKKILFKCLDESHIPYEVIKDGGETLVVPKGAEELDRKLVSEPLLWLNAYPTSRKAFLKALKEYSKVTEDNASEVADLLRKALESFFQEFFNCEKSFENMISIYGKFLEEKGVPKDIANNLEKILKLYQTFNNNYAKHHDKTHVNVLEYILYQTGNIIRLLIQLN